jgi:hypothetical protein
MEILLTLATCLSSLGAQQLEIRVGKAPVEEPLKPQPGDSVEIDGSTRDIVATSNGMTIRFPMQNRIEPQISVTISRSGSEYVYTYTLTNGPGALQWIPGFSLECRFPEEVQMKAPATWSALPGGPAVDFQTLYYLNALRDDDMARHLSASRSAGPFQMTSRLLPGLVAAVFHAAPPPRLAAELAEGEKLGFLSPWARERVAQLTPVDRSTKRIITLGPKVLSDSDNLSNIRMELAYASGQPQFSDLRFEMTMLVRDAAKQTVQSKLSNLKGTAFQNQFFQAMLWRLERLRD